MKNPDPALPISTQPPRSPVQLQELIRQRAYELWESAEGKMGAILMIGSRRSGK